MPTVIDNITVRLLDPLREMLEVSYGADFCVGYFHLRGWRKIADLIQLFEGADGRQARVLVGMTRTPEDDLHDDLSLIEPSPVGPKEAKLREVKLVESFRQQLTFGMPDNSSEAGLRQLAKQLRAHKVLVKLFLRYQLHAKLYLTYNDHPAAPIKAFLGSSNLTAPGLSEQGELNVDVTDSTATCQLREWFAERWEDRYARDISDLLAQIIEESWAREQLVSPYLVYLKIAYHLAFEALEAPREYKLPRIFEEIVLDFQKEAILRLRRMLRTDPSNPNGNRVAIIGDVVGMGKTLTATAVASIFLEGEGKCVVCCPPKLVGMWKSYLQQYDVNGIVVPYSQTKKLTEIKGRTRLLILDESHNLRNRETIAWTHIHDFIRDQYAKVLMLLATPYNKHYQDLANQLRLVLDEKADLGIRPEMYFRTISEDVFFARHQASPRSLVAFAKSESPDDWRDLLTHFLVRRTRGYIIKKFALYDEERDRHYLVLKNGLRSYFPKRVPRTLRFPIEDGDQYSALFNQSVVDTINGLQLPRYGLGRYVHEAMYESAPAGDADMLDNLSQAGKRLIGYCRVNLFKRLESSGYCFLLSLERHVLRNLVFVHAIDHGLDLPIGTQDSSILDTAMSDIDPDSSHQLFATDITVDDHDGEEEITEPVTTSLAELTRRAERVYETYAAMRKRGRHQFKWISSRYFDECLRENLLHDAAVLLKIISEAGAWRAAADAKVESLYNLLTGTEAESKILVFTQFADTAEYLAKELTRGKRKMNSVEAVTAESANPADQVRRFSPKSNNHEMRPGERPIRVLIATEVLSEGQNCQDANVVVNYDLPWAIIRLIQRAGRVDRIGQDNAEIRVYSCLPADGVEKQIRLRNRLVSRLTQNQEVIGTDKRFFEEEYDGLRLRDLYAERAGSLDDDGGDDEDVDMPSRALAIWEEALKENPGLERQVKALPDQVAATRAVTKDHGVLVYFKTADGFDSLAKVDPDGHVVTQSLLAILKQAACPPGEEALPRHPRHHELVRTAVKEAIKEYLEEGGNLGARTSARRRVYERLTGYRADLRGNPTLFAQADVKDLESVIDEIYKHPLTERAREICNRRLREGVNDAALLELAVGLHDQGLLTYPSERPQDKNPKLICSIGLFPREVVTATGVNG